jgi:hypothetical protein
MGRTYLFECPKCGYRAKVAGGAQDGFNFAVQTILCRDCKELYDAVIRMRVLARTADQTKGLRLRLRNTFARNPKVSRQPPTFLAALNRMPPPGRTTSTWTNFPLRCPVSSSHRVQAWKSPGKCPRCGVYLEHGAVPYRMWD